MPSISPRRARSAIPGAWGYVAWAVVLVAVALRLPQPLHGDTALFVTMAHGMHEGQYLYRDLWDIKPPGIFLFYYAIGSTLGYSLAGVRVFEALYQLALCVVLVHALRPIVTNRGVVWLVPVLTCGTYYAIGTSWFLGQPEALAAPLIALSAISAFRATDDRGSLQWSLASGLFAGIAILIKPVFVLIPLSSWCLAAWWVYRSSGAARVLQCALVIGAASIAPLAVTGIAFLLDGELGDLMRVLFIDPLKMARAVGPKWPDLRESVEWAAPFAPAAVAAFGLAWWRADSERRRFLLLLAFWVASTGFVIGIQIQSWWSYHFMLFLWPCAVAVALGVQALLAFKSRAGQIAAVAILGLWFVQWTALRDPIRAMAQTGYPRDSGSLILYQIALNDPRGAIRKFLEETEPDREKSGADHRIFVFGNPLVYYLTDSLQAIRMNGWTPEYYGRDQWEELATELRRQVPYRIYVARRYAEPLARDHPDVGEELATQYSVMARVADGIWYERIDSR